MFGFGKKRRAEKEAAEKASDEAGLRANLVDLIGIAEGGVGQVTDWPLVLKPGERMVYGLQGAGLFEPRRQPGHYSGRSAGVSVPVVDGIRLRLGKSAGTFVQGNEKPALIDTGDATFTTQRVVFQGSKYTREWLYAKLIGIMHSANQPWTEIQVSNRQKTSGIVYTNPTSDEVRLRLTVAVAIFNGEGQETADKLRDELSKLDRAVSVAPKPGDNANHPAAESPSDNRTTASPGVTTDPATARADDTSTAPLGGSQEARVETPEPTSNPKPLPAASSESPLTLPPPMWAADPARRHQSRYWDGATWTEYVSDNGQESRDPAP
jgi:hypothetical protein